MLALGLTGGIGMGKSTAAAWLAAAGVAVVDTDDLARRVVAPGEPALDEIRAAFGAEMIRSDGSLDRTRLAALVFADATARTRLEAITHPRIRCLWEAALADWRRRNEPVGVVVIPLLFEVGLAAAFDRVLCLACDAATQRARLAPRGWSDAECARRLAAQWPIARKMAAADHVIWTEGSMKVHHRQWRILLKSVLIDGSTSKP